jgi:3-dehydroquinate synthase
MKTLNVELGPRSYPIHIGPGLLQRADLVTPHVRGKQVFIVTNETVGPLYLDKARALLRDFQCDVLALPDGEQYKNLDACNAIFDALLSKRHDRHTTLVALGGGVVGDITGFAAACYQRGVDFIQIPTTLLAQVDSSVGGKTGVNHALGKNMIGAFHQPVCVLADTDTLATLDDRELSAGLAEVIKYGLIRDPEFLLWLENNLPKLLARDATALIHAIERSCRNKAEVVAADERESGVRALLNFGHTFGHAIETGTGYHHWLHGEAVAVGMLMAADMSMRMGWITGDDVHRIDSLIDRAQLPTRGPAELDTNRFIELMGVDKKVKDGKIHLLLLRAIGNAVVTGDYPPELLRATIDEHHAVRPARGIGL